MPGLEVNTALVKYSHTCSWRALKPLHHRRNAPQPVPSRQQGIDKNLPEENKLVARAVSKPRVTRGVAWQKHVGQHTAVLARVPFRPWDPQPRQTGAFERCWKSQGSSLWCCAQCPWPRPQEQAREPLWASALPMSARVHLGALVSSAFRVEWGSLVGHQKSLALSREICEAAHALRASKK